MKNHFDAVIVGGGPAGSYLAYNLSKDGFKVILIDNKPLSHLWDKPCGAIASPLILNYLDRMGINRDIAIEEKYNYVKVFNRNMNEIAEVKLPLIKVNRQEVGKELANELCNVGVKIIDKKMGVKLKVRDDIVSAVILNNGENICGRLIIDATGFTGILRHQLRGKIPEWLIDKEDLVIAVIEDNSERRRLFETFSLIIDKGIVPGGYAWYTPLEDRTIIGIGLQPVIPNIMLSKRLLYIKKLIGIRGKILGRSIGVIYARRALASFVYNGYAMVGDAGAQGNPLLGGGILGAFIGANIAYEQIKKALEESKGENLMISDLWGYNIEFMKKRGRLLAILDIIRLFTQALSNEDLIRFARQLPQEITFKLDDIVKIGMETLGTIIKARIFWKMIDVIKAIQRIQILFDKYPNSPEKIFEWTKEVNSIFSEFKKDIYKRK